MSTHILLTTLIIQQQAAPMNIQIPKLKLVNDNDDMMNAIPPINYTPINIVCVEKYWVKYLINDPPNK